MKRIAYIIFVLLSVLEVQAQFRFFKSKSPFDYNGDGVIRCAILGVGGKDMQVDNAQTCVDLEQMIKNSNPGMPVRVMFEEITLTKTIMGWWYHPDAKEQRNAFVSASYDFVFLAENKTIVSRFPELFFEGVRISRNRFSRRKTNVMLLMMDSPPASSVRDSSVHKLTELTYRVADGCGVKVVPTALAWQDVMKHHILPGKSLLKMRANSFLAASAIWCRISGDRVPRSSLTTGWVVKKTASLMARSARDAVNLALSRRHYSGPYRGVTRMESRVQERYMIYYAGTTANPALQDALGGVLDSAGHIAVQYSPADWYAEGFDRHSAPLDLICGSMQEMEPLLDESRYSSMEFVPENLPEPFKVVYRRNPANDESGEQTLRNLEELLMDGYRFARKNKLVFIPFQVAWARLWSINAAYVKEASGRSSNDWLNYMLANMINSSLTGCYQIPPDRDKPHHYNKDHPRGFYSIAVRTGWQCMRQLSELKMNRNSLVTSRRGRYIDKSTPGFISLRLLEPPRETVRVLCEPAQPNILSLSGNVFEFNSDNFNIEQSIRCTVVGGEESYKCDVLINALSDDKDIDGVSTKIRFLLNHTEAQPSGFSFNKSRVTLADKSFVMLKPSVQPFDFVNVQILQHGVETASVTFSPEYYDSYPVCLFPVAKALAAGKSELVVKASSGDKRFDGYKKRFVFDLDYPDLKLPDVKVISPKADARIAGPAFVTAEAAAGDVKGPCKISLFCGKKRLGVEQGRSIKAGVEMGPPLSRLGAGEYPVWAALRLGDGLVISSPVSMFRVATE